MGVRLVLGALHGLARAPPRTRHRVGSLNTGAHRPDVTLVVLAAGESTRFGRPKQLEPIGPSGEPLFAYTVADAVRAGCRHVVFVVRGVAGAAVARAASDLLAGGGLVLDFVEQPPGRRSGGRSRPLGTGHALLAAASEAHEVCLVANADDTYGPGACSALIGTCRSAEDPGLGAVAAYRLAGTLSEAGGVSRAVLQLDPSARVLDIVEGKDLALRDGRVRGRRPTGEALTLDAEAPVSMNLWALRRGHLDRLADQFADWEAEHGDDGTAEFLLSEAMGEQAREGAALLAVPVDGPTFGVTFRDDLEGTRRGVAALVERGAYPADVSAWLRARRGVTLARPPQEP